MAEEFQKVITIKLPIYVRQKPNGVYEARFRAHGYNISVSSIDYGKLKPKFIEALKKYEIKTSQKQVLLEPPKSTLFEEVAERWLELKRPAIKANTYKFYVQLFGASISPVFAGRELSAVKQSDVQEVINSYIEQGKYRTATKNLPSAESGI